MLWTLTNWWRQELIWFLGYYYPSLSVRLYVALWVTSLSFGNLPLKQFGFFFRYFAVTQVMSFSFSSAGRIQTLRKLPKVSFTIGVSAFWIDLFVCEVFMWFSVFKSTLVDSEVCSVGRSFRIASMILACVARWNLLLHLSVLCLDGCLSDKVNDIFSWESFRSFAALLCRPSSYVVNKASAFSGNVQLLCVTYQCASYGIRHASEHYNILV